MLNKQKNKAKSLIQWVFLLWSITLPLNLFLKNVKIFLLLNQVHEGLSENNKKSFHFKIVILLLFINFRHTHTHTHTHTHRVIEWVMANIPKHVFLHQDKSSNQHQKSVISKLGHFIIFFFFFYIYVSLAYETVVWKKIKRMKWMLSKFHSQLSTNARK